MIKIYKSFAFTLILFSAILFSNVVQAQSVSVVLPPNPVAQEQPVMTEDVPANIESISTEQSQSGNVISEDDPAYVAPAGESVVAPAEESRFLKTTENKISVQNLLLLDPQVRDRIIENIDRYNVVPGMISKDDLLKLPLSTQHHVQNLPQIFSIK